DEILISYETYAHVRDQIRCEERGHISVKGIAYPVATYQVVDTYESLATEHMFIHEERPNLRLDLDLDAMSADDRAQAAATLRDALDRLAALDTATTTVGKHETVQAAPAQASKPEAAALLRLAQTRRYTDGK